MMNYFERGIARDTSTTRLPKKLRSEIQETAKKISENADLKISANDILTIGAILVCEANIDNEQLKKLNSISDLCDLLKNNLHGTRD